MIEPPARFRRHNGVREDIVAVDAGPRSRKTEIGNLNRCCAMIEQPGTRTLRMPLEINKDIDAQPRISAAASWSESWPIRWRPG